MPDLHEQRVGPAGDRLAELSRLIADPDPPREDFQAVWGPWVGVEEDAQDICAVVDCLNRGKPQVCLADGRYHHHGCIHYDRLGDQAGLQFRKGWGWLCDTHYAQLKKAAGMAEDADPWTHLHERKRTL